MPAWPCSKPGSRLRCRPVSLDRMCASGQQAIHFAAQAIASGQADVVIAGGVESMTRVPMGADFPSNWSPKLTERGDAEISVNQGISADLIAERWNLSREELDALLVPESPAGREGVAGWPLLQPDHAGRGDRRETAR